MSGADKTDFKRTLDAYGARSGEIRVLDVPALQYLMIDGHGDPNTDPTYVAALETLYPVAYTTKGLSRSEHARDYVVPPLEALWWADDHAVFTSARDKTAWDWTVMLMTPEWITEETVERAVSAVRTKGRGPRLDDLRLDTLDEGLCVQTLHVGPYDDEAVTLADLHDRFVPEHGLRLAGKHHEIYLSDPRRVAPARLRTILRQPVERLP